MSGPDWTDLARQLLGQKSPAELEASTREDVHALASSLASVLEEARATWPAVTLDLQRFVTFIAARVSPEERALDGLRQLCTRDLYLACACLEQDERAIRLFLDKLFPSLAVPLERLKLSPAEIEETQSLLRRELFTPRTHAAPTLSNYLGRGALKSWLRVVAVRTAMHQIGRHRAEIPSTQRALDLALEPAMDPELELLKRRYTDSFKQAFRAALETLSPRERLVLRQRYIDRVGANQLAELYGVHRTTITRWVDGAQEKLLERTRQRLIEDLALSASECESLVRLVRSRLDLTLSAL